MGNTLRTLPQIPPPSHQEQHGEEQPQQQLAAADEDHEFTCEICIEPVSIPSKKFRNSNKCSHPFCNDCVIKYITVKIEEDNVGQIRCPAVDCNHKLDPLTCSSLIGPSLFVRWCDVLCEAAIVDLDKCYCPIRNCNELIVNECGGNLKKSSCPKCKRWFCFQCKRVWHAGFGCEESEELRDGNELAFGRLAERKNWRRCPRCRHFVELREGCSIVKCRCGISFCYKCGKQVHQHWCRCDTTSMYCEWCFRSFLVLVILTAALLFWLWLANVRKNWQRN